MDSRAALAYSWSITESGTTTSVTQVSARLYWRVSGASSWNQINASGSTKSLTVPAYTFPPNSTIEWYLNATVPNSVTCSSSTATFKTQAFSISVLSAPTGSNIDTRSAIYFSWKIANSSGDATQTSAKFYWRVSGAASYTQVNVSGNTKNVSIPANTFPTGKTIQWYVSATVQGGTTLSTSATTFSTVSTQITLDTYPSGNSVYTAAGIEFTWHFASSAGNYGQTSAKLYWRTSTSQAYTEISVSGNTQSLTVPANTFPTNKTIQWYLEGTDIGGLTSSTSVMSFDGHHADHTAELAHQRLFRPAAAHHFSVVFCLHRRSGPPGIGELLLARDGNFHLDIGGGIRIDSKGHDPGQHLPRRDHHRLVRGRHRHRRNQQHLAGLHLLHDGFDGLRLPAGPDRHGGRHQQTADAELDPGQRGRHAAVQGDTAVEADNGLDLDHDQGIDDTIHGVGGRGQLLPDR